MSESKFEEYLKTKRKKERKKRKYILEEWLYVGLSRENRAALVGLAIFGPLVITYIMFSTIGLEEAQFVRELLKYVVVAIIGYYFGKMVKLPKAGLSILTSKKVSCNLCSTVFAFGAMLTTADVVVRGMLFPFSTLGWMGISLMAISTMTYSVVRNVFKVS